MIVLVLKTGSGKTYTMGTNYSGEGSTGGIIPKVMETIFKRVGTTKDNTEFLIRVSFIEVNVGFQLLVVAWCGSYLLCIYC